MSQHLIIIKLDIAINIQAKQSTEKWRNLESKSSQANPFSLECRIKQANGYFVAVRTKKNGGSDEQCNISTGTRRKYASQKAPFRQ